MPTASATDTFLEVTPQPTEINLGSSIELDILTDADTISTDTDNSNVSVSVKSSHEDATDSAFTHFITEIVGATEGDTHIEITATATNKTKAIVTWDIKVIDSNNTQPTTPPTDTTDPITPPTDTDTDTDIDPDNPDTPPAVQPTTPTPPTFEYPLKVEKGKQYIDEYFNIVIPIKEYPQRRLLNGAFVDVVKCHIYDKDLEYEKAYFTKDGKRVNKEFTYSDFSLVGKGDIVEYDNKYIEVLRDFVSYIDWAVVDSVDNTSKIINLSKNAVNTIEINDQDYQIIINGGLKLTTLNEAKFNQVCKFLGLIDVFI